MKCLYRGPNTTLYNAPCQSYSQKQSESRGFFSNMSSLFPSTRWRHSTRSPRQPASLPGLHPPSDHQPQTCHVVQTARRTRSCRDAGLPTHVDPPPHTHTYTHTHQHIQSYPHIPQLQITGGGCLVTVANLKNIYINIYFLFSRKMYILYFPICRHNITGLFFCATGCYNSETVCT